MMEDTWECCGAPKIDVMIEHREDRLCYAVDENGQPV
jgi:hypothetical protein